MSFLRPIKKSSRRPQPTPEAMVTALLNLIETKFYPGHPIPFAKDRSNLLKLVVLWPAGWLNRHGVSLTADSYQSRLSEIIIDAAAHFDGARVKYLPAWLGVSVQRHFDHHEDEIYDEGKALRNALESAVAQARGSIVRERDPVRELAQLSSVLRAAKGRKAPKAAPEKQLDFKLA